MEQPRDQQEEDLATATATHGIEDQTLHFVPRRCYRGGGLVMENVERQEAHYGQGGLNSRLIPQRLLQYLHQRTTSIYRPHDDPGRDQGIRREAEPQIP